MRDQIVSLTLESSNKVKEQKEVHERSYEEKIRYLREDFQTKITILQSNLSIAQNELRNKETELLELLKQYEKMRSEMVVISEQEAHKKNITLKFAGATADLIASKNMFDVFIKSKVLSSCGDALRGKEN